MADKEIEESKKVYDVQVVEEFDEFFNLKQTLSNLIKQIGLSQKYEKMLL